MTDDDDSETRENHKLDDGSEYFDIKGEGEDIDSTITPKKYNSWMN